MRLCCMRWSAVDQYWVTLAVASQSLFTGSVAELRGQFCWLLMIEGMRPTRLQLFVQVGIRRIRRGIGRRSNPRLTINNGSPDLQRPYYRRNFGAGQQ